jgi:hypothetical protein
MIMTMIMMMMTTMMMIMDTAHMDI